MPSQVVNSTISPRMNFFLFISIILIICMALASVGLFIYKTSLVNSIKGLQESLAVAKDSFQPESISELQIFDKRMSASNQILASHTVLSPVFALLSEITIPTIQFTRLSLEPGVDGKNFTARLSGLARSYKSIAVQIDVFNGSKGKYFKNVVFSNLVLQNDKNSKGYVSFDLSFTIDPALLSYEKSLLTNKSKTQ